MTHITHICIIQILTSALCERTDQLRQIEREWRSVIWDYCWLLLFVIPCIVVLLILILVIIITIIITIIIVIIISFIAFRSRIAQRISEFCQKHRPYKSHTV